MDTVLKCISRLQEHFENFELRPAVSVDKVMALTSFFPGMTEEIIAFYKYCNGFDCHIQDLGSDGSGRIYSVENIEENIGYMKSYENDNLYTGMFPIKDDGCGNNDFLWLHEDVAQGSVIFWDHETEDKPEYLLGGSFSKYLSFLCDYLITCYHPDGTIKAEYDIDNPDMLEYPWPFDSEYLAANDSKSKAIVEHAEYGKVFNID